MLSARELMAAEGFSRSRREIEERLTLADEMRTVLAMEPGAEIGEQEDLRSIIDKIAVEGAYLMADECAVLLRALRGVSAIVGFIRSRREGSYPALRRMTERVQLFPELQREIERVVDDKGEVRSSASQELAEIRRAIREHEGQVAKRLQQVLQRAKASGIVEADAMISIRDGHAVIPVAAANKRKLAGFIHDESATGRTFYVEPVEVVELNNQLRELEYAERREIVRLLTEFTEELRPDAEPIAVAGEYLAEMDAVRAKARWAVENRAGKPIVSEDDRMVLRNAFHPLLAQTLRREKKELVPLDMQLDREKHILVISGPNAGGKSVCLKTTGIVQYMFQCGFPVTAGERSELPVFESICIDIGDEQSMDNDLSTYSSHLMNMKSMLQAASSRTLVLIDEFGSGTEPVIGGAIAEAILERLLEKGCYGVITTHYSNIKYYATGTEGIANGAMMFDVQNIRPLFRLEMGEPGSSFAIEIARKIGLPEDIIRSASEKAGSEVISLERQLREVARNRNYWEQKRERIRIADKRVEEMESEYASRLSKLKEERAAIIRQAKEDAKNILDQTNRTIENTVRVIRESQAEKETTRLARREIESLKESVLSDVDYISAESERVEREMEKIERRRQKRAERKAQRGESVAQETQPEEPKVLPIEVVAIVRIVCQDGVGEVVSMKGKKATIAIGQIMTTIAIDRLEAISNSEFKKQTRPTTARTVVSVDISSRKLNFRDNIDVRGERSADALEIVKDFIDDAIMVGIGSVTILHGKGTGALKEEIRRYLRYIPQVASATDDHPDRGGAGVTVVKFK